MPADYSAGKFENCKGDSGEVRAIIATAELSADDLTLLFCILWMAYNWAIVISQWEFMVLLRSTKASLLLQLHTPVRRHPVASPLQP